MDTRRSDGSHSSSEDHSATKQRVSCRDTPLVCWEDVERAVEEIDGESLDMLTKMKTIPTKIESVLKCMCILLGTDGGIHQKQNSTSDVTDSTYSEEELPRYTSSSNIFADTRTLPPSAYTSCARKILSKPYFQKILLETRRTFCTKQALEDVRAELALQDYQTLRKISRVASVIYTWCQAIILLSDSHV
eukprot:gene1853-4950_t